MTRVRQCGLAALLCGLWNLFGDLCFMDFYLAHMTFDGFGTIAASPRPGRLFDFSEDWPLKLAQASGWMYPVWAVATAYPLYVGLHTAGAAWRCCAAPCALLAYGLCVVGGALHSGFAFATVLPRVLHAPQLLNATANSSTCACMQAAQAKVMESYVFGYTPGPQAVMVASLWIAYVVATRETGFPRWFILFTPLVTVAWVAVVGFLVLPDPWGTLFVGTFGTWIILVMNIATTCILWNVPDVNLVDDDKACE